MPKQVKQRKPRDVNQAAFSMVARSTAEPETETLPKRRKRIIPEEVREYMAKIGSKGGKKGGKLRLKDNPERRREIAAEAARARWSKTEGRSGG